MNRFNLNFVLKIGLLLLYSLNVYVEAQNRSSENYYTYVNVNEVSRGYYAFEHVKSSSKQYNTDNVAIETEANHEFGWYTQRIKVFDKLPDEFAAYQLGFTEIYSIIDQVKAHWKNTWGSICDPKSLSHDCNLLKTTLQSQIDYAITEAFSTISDTSHHLLLGLWQLKGASDAFNGHVISNSHMLTHDYVKTLREDIFGTYIISVSGDLPDIVSKLNLKSLLEPVQRLQIMANAIIKKTSVGSNDLIFAHITKSHYLQTLKIMKSVSLPWVYRYNYKQGRPIPGANMKYSSYPGALSSLDDYYQTDSLVVMKSANEDMWSKVNPEILYSKASRNIQDAPVLNETIPTALRAMIAMRLEEDNIWWGVRFTHYPHQVDCSTWLVFRRNGYDPNTGSLEVNTLSVLELSGHFVYLQDVTKQLDSTGKIVQIGIPYFKNVYEKLGYAEMAAIFGRYFTQDDSPIKKILNRDLDASYNLDIMRANLRNNNFMHDKFAKCACRPPYSSSLAASPRGDLNKPDGRYGNIPWLDYRLSGAIDFKAFSLQSPKTHTLQFGPTHMNTMLPAFSWKKHAKSTPDYLPDVYDFAALKIEM